MALAGQAFHGGPQCAIPAGEVCLLDLISRLIHVDTKLAKLGLIDGLGLWMRLMLRVHGRMRSCHLTG